MPITMDDDDGFPDVDRKSCELLGETALIVQALMGVLVICSLAYKRQRESPKRPWKIWLFDVSKQVSGQLFVHGVNVLISDVVADLGGSNACVFYFLNILLDTTLGVALLYFILKALTYVCTERFHLKGLESGKYGNPPLFKYWVRQSTIYVVALTSMKFLVILLLALFPGLDNIGSWLLSWTWTSEGDSLQVIFTMGVFPIIMNILQFWLIDSIVKAKDALALDGDAPDALSRSEQEPLFDTLEDDEDTGSSNDLESQYTVARTRSPARFHYDKPTSGPATPYENKSSGSSTPGETLELHAYPPSISHPFPSTSSSTKLNSKRRLKPPAPITIHSSSNQPAVNSPGSRLSTPADASNKEWADDWRDAGDGGTRNIRKTVRVRS